MLSNTMAAHTMTLMLDVEKAESMDHQVHNTHGTYMHSIAMNLYSIHFNLHSPFTGVEAGLGVGSNYKE